MTLRAALGALVATTSLAGCSMSDAATAQQLPDVTLTEFSDDSRVELTSLQGPLVINLWASYCKPCRREMPVLQAFHEQHGDDVGVVGIDYQDPQKASARELVADTGVTYRLLADPLGELNSADPFPNLMGLPFLALVDDDGTVVFMEYGEVESVEELEGLVDEHLGLDL